MGTVTEWLNNQLVFYEDLDYTSSSQSLTSAALERRRKLEILIDATCNLPMVVIQIICNYEGYEVPKNKRVVYLHLPTWSTTNLTKLNEFITHTRSSFQEWWKKVAEFRQTRFTFVDSGTTCQYIHNAEFYGLPVCLFHRRKLQEDRKTNIDEHSQPWHVNKFSRKHEEHKYAFPMWYAHTNCFFPNLLRHHCVDLTCDLTCASTLTNTLHTLTTGAIETKDEKSECEKDKCYPKLDFLRRRGELKALPGGTDDLQIELAFNSRTAIKNFVEMLIGALRQPDDFHGMELLPGLVIRQLSGQPYGEIITQLPGHAGMEHCTPDSKIVHHTLLK